MKKRKISSNDMRSGDFRMVVFSKKRSLGSVEPDDLFLYARHGHNLMMKLYCYPFVLRLEHSSSNLEGNPDKVPLQMRHFMRAALLCHGAFFAFYPIFRKQKTNNMKKYLIQKKHHIVAIKPCCLPL